MDINTLAKQDFMDYSMEVIKNRAIPGIDGNKPIHRRILYIMKDVGNVSNKPTRKCAKITGEIMGRAHPHGSSSIYDALVRLSQPWKMRYPLVEMQGNNGNIQGDKPAAERYTECRLSPIGELMCKDIDKQCVPMELNYSDEEELPLLLTSEFPNLLCNPSLGIAVSMSSTTLPHNVGEVCDALVAYLRAKDFTVDDLFKYIKGPDFPTGATVINGNELKTIYANGKGSIKVRSKYHVETVSGKANIIIEEIPYLVNPMEKIYDKIKKMVIEDEYNEIENIQNNIGNHGFEIRIICAKGANVNRVIKWLSEKTGFQSSISMNNTVLVNGQPRKMTYIEMMDEYIKFRHQVMIKVAEFDKAKAEARLHIVDGLIKAIADIDNVIKIIKGCGSRDEARQALIARYEFSLEQTNAILDMRLSKLTHLEINDLQTERGELAAKIDQQKKIIANVDNCRTALLINQFIAIKTKFGDKRRTVINNLEENNEDVAPKEVINMVTTNNNIIVVEPFDKLQLNKKGSPFAREIIKFGYKTRSNAISYLVGRDARIFKVDNTLMDIGAVNPFIIDSDLVCAIPELSGDFVVTVTKNGIVKKSLISEYAKISRPTQICKLRENDELIWAGCGKANDWLLLLGKGGKLIKLKLAAINASSRATIGSKGIDDEVIGATIASDEQLIFSVAVGKAKFTLCSDYTENARGGTGQTITENTSLIAAITDTFYTIEKGVKISRHTNKSFAVKGKTALGAKFTDEQIVKMIT